jgi:hypothetical protein
MISNGPLDGEMYGVSQFQQVMKVQEIIVVF